MLASFWPWTFECLTSDFSNDNIKRMSLDISWLVFFKLLDAQNFTISIYLVNVLCISMLMFVYLCHLFPGDFTWMLVNNHLILSSHGCIHPMFASPLLHVSLISYICLAGSAVTLFPMTHLPFLFYCLVALIPDVDRPNAGHVKFKEEGRCCFPAQRF